MKPEVKTKYYDIGQKRYEEHRLNGKRHNETGPAVQVWYENGQIAYEEYWLNDIQVTKDKLKVNIDSYEIF